MVRSKENGISVAPFLVKCYEMVSDETTNDLISWNESSSSSSFVIWDESKFCSQLLPKYFKHSNFSSFVRQLNIYGFRKVDTDRWEFENQSFIKGHKHLLNNITRRKQPPHTLLLQQKHVQADAHADADKRRTALWKEVENLKADKNALTQELINLRQHQETSQSKLLLLREQFKGVEKNQQQMLSFIVMAMQRPELFAQFLHPKENNNNNNNNWRVRVPKTGKNKKLSDTRENCEPISSDGMIVRYQPPSIQEDSVFAVDSDSDDLMGLDFTSDEMRDLLMDIDLLFGPPQENLPSSDNDGQFIRPDMIPENDDTMLDQLLFSSPKEYEQYPKLDDASSSSMNIEPDALNLVDTSENVVEALTEQMVFLSPEMK